MEPRKFAKISQEEFKDLMLQLIQENVEKEELSDPDLNLEGKAAYAIYELSGEKLEKDLDVEFDFENTETYGEEGLGFQSIGDFNYFGVSAGGDWEDPIYFIVYFDENKEVRAYIPEDGNVYNKKLKSAFGNNGERETMDYSVPFGTPPKKIRVEYNDIDAANEQYGLNLDDDSDYFSAYEHDIKFDFNKIKEEISNKIQPAE
jgi:hypothetical protein